MKRMTRANIYDVPDTLLVPKSLILNVVMHALAEMPREACGLLVSRDGVLEAVPCQNDAPEEDAFDICVKDIELWHVSGLPMLGTYHSHPRGRAEPSEGDIELLEPNKLHLIVAMKSGLHVQLWQYLNWRITPILIPMEIV